jgi:hypothetical protein
MSYNLQEDKNGDCLAPADPGWELLYPTAYIWLVGSSLFNDAGFAWLHVCDGTEIEGTSNTTKLLNACSSDHANVATPENTVETSTNS